MCTPLASLLRTIRLASSRFAPVVAALLLAVPGPSANASPLPGGGKAQVFAGFLEFCLHDAFGLQPDRADSLPDGALRTDSETGHSVNARVEGNLLTYVYSGDDAETFSCTIFLDDPAPAPETARRFADALGVFEWPEDKTRRVFCFEDVPISLGITTFAEPDDFAASVEMAPAFHLWALCQ